MMTGRDVGGDVPSEMTAICAFLPLHRSRRTAGISPSPKPTPSPVLRASLTAFDRSPKPASDRLKGSSPFDGSLRPDEPPSPVLSLVEG
jgi:hypothetical protein